MLAQGLDHSKACVLIALDRMFGDSVDWGKDFLTDYFVEFGQNGFLIKDFYLIEESAPLVIINKRGSYTGYYQQGDVYWTFIDRQTKTRYRLPIGSGVIYVYEFSSTNSHAEYIHAEYIPVYLVNDYFRQYAMIALFLPKHGLIIDTYHMED